MSARRIGSVLRDPRQVVCALRLLVLAGLAMLGTTRPTPHPFLYWFIVSVYAATILGYLWARTKDFELRRVKFAIFLFDVSIVSLLILLRGDGVSPFLTAYFGLVLMAAMVEGLGNALFNALLVSTLYAALTHWGSRPAELLDTATLSQFVFFFIIAIFMGHIAEEGRQEARTRKQAQAALANQSSELKKSTEALKNARDALRASDRLATLGMLSAGIAHEIRSPIAAIHSGLEPASEILDELLDAVARGTGAAELRAELDEILADCRTACTHLARVARDLTAMARDGQARPVPVDPREVIGTAVRMLRTRTGAGVRIETSLLTDQHLLGDPGRVLQVLLNLATNAIDAMEEKGGGTLGLEALDADAEHVAFVVRDTGPGIPPEVRERLYQPFFTTKKSGRGTGLGLHVVSEIVKAYQGRIDFDSVVGEGTTFRVAFPRAHPLLSREPSHDRKTSEDHPDRGRRGHDPQGFGQNAEEGALRSPARV